MFSLDNLPTVALNKSADAKEAFVDAANKSLAKGRSVEEAELAGISAMSVLARLSTKLTKGRSRVIPSHVPTIEQIALVREQESVKKAKEIEDSKVLLESIFNKSKLPQGVNRNIIAANYDSLNRLVIVFDTGERITTKAIDIKSYIENHIVMSTGDSGGSVTPLPTNLAYKFFARYNLTSLVPVTVVHGLDLVDKDAYTINIRQDNQNIDLFVESIDGNTLQVISMSDLSDVAITIIG